MAYKSGEFLVPTVGRRPVPQAVACFNQQIWLIGAGVGDGTDPFGLSMWESKLSLSQGGEGGTKTIDLPGGAATSDSNWQTSRLNIPGLGGASATTGSRCAAAPLTDTLYLFWNQTSLANECSLRASSYTINGEGAFNWSTALTLQSTSGAALKPNFDYAPAFAEVDATPFGTDTVIVACARIPNPSAANVPNIYVGTFRVKDINRHNHTWKATGEVWVPLKALQDTAPTPGVRDLGHQISIDWFNSNDGPNKDRPYWLWISLTPYSGPDQAGAMVVPLDEKGIPFPNANHGGYRLHGWPSPYGYFAVRDPAGRIRTYVNRWHNATLDISSYNTFNDVGTDTSKPPIPAAAVEPLTAAGDAGTPSVVFFTDMNNKKSITVQDQKGKHHKGTQYPVYELIFYPAENMMGQVNLFGYAQVLPDYAQFKPVPKVAETFISAGIVDGPIPVPQENLQKVTFQSTQPNFGTVSYSTTVANETRHEVSNSWSVGIRSQGGLSQGFGPAWDIAVSGGTGYVSGDVSTASNNETRNKQSLLDTRTLNANDQHPERKLIPAGTVFCTTAEVHATTYRFVDADEKPIADGVDSQAGKQAPLFVHLTTTFTDAGLQEYLPYAVTPGDLHSYTPEALNTRMKRLLRSGDPYYGDHYFEDVIVPHAYTFASGRKFLEFAWSGGATRTARFEATSSTFTEQSWKIDASVYAGVSGGGGASLFGDGFEASFSFLVGSTYSHTANTTSTATNGWGIAISEGRIGPPSFDVDVLPSAVSEYIFRLYFLPPPAPPSKLLPNYWAWELKTLLKRASQRGAQFAHLDPSQIDEFAGSWKIMYVVTKYQYNDSNKKKYEYAGRPVVRPTV